MRKINLDKHTAILLLIFFSAFIIRIVLQGLTEDSNFAINYINHIKEHITPLFYDSLSYGGRAIDTPFLFYYFLAALTLLGNKLLLLIIPSLLLAALSIIIYLTALKFTNKNLALICALLSAFIPISFKTNLASPYSLGFPILFLLIYSFLQINKRPFLYLFLALSFILPLTSQLALFFSLAIILYFIFTAIEKKKLTGLEKEALLFSLFVNLLIYSLIFKRSFITYGLNTIWQNVPDILLKNYFTTFTFFEAFYLIGAILLLFGGIGFFFSFRQKETLILTSISAASLIILWLKIIPFSQGLFFLALNLAILSAIGLEKTFNFLKETKFHNFEKAISILIITLIALSSIFPSIQTAIESKNIISKETASTLEKFQEKETEKTILAPLEYGYAITAFGNKNLADKSFLLAPSPNQRINDIKAMYFTRSENYATELFTKYDIDFIIFDSHIKQKFNISKIHYEQCIREAYSESKSNAIIYKFVC